VIETTWEDVIGFARAIASILWIPLAAAVGGIALAAAWVTSRIIARRAERRFAPGVMRWSRRRAGLRADARPWACPACRSVNPPTVVTCYRCRMPRSGEAPELREAVIDPAIFHPREPTNQFDPSLYRGPGAPPPAAPGPRDPPTSVGPG
jgi:hypothetical protein